MPFYWVWDGIVIGLNSRIIKKENPNSKAMCLLWQSCVVFTSFNSHMAGVVIASTTLFGSQPPMPNEALTQAFQVDDAIVNSIKSKFGS